MVIHDFKNTPKIGRLEAFVLGEPNWLQPDLGLPTMSFDMNVRWLAHIGSVEMEAHAILAQNRGHR